MESVRVSFDKLLFSPPKPNDEPFSASSTSTLALGDAGGESFVFACEYGDASAAFVWFDDHLVCQTGVYKSLTPDNMNINMTDGSVEEPLLLLSKQNVVVRTHVFSSGPAVTLSVNWSKDGAQFEPIDAALLTPTINSAEIAREENAAATANGWGLWNHQSLLDVVLLPEGTRVMTSICRVSTSECQTRQYINADFTVRPTQYSYDRSFIQYYTSFMDVNVSIAISGGDDRLLIATEIESCHGNCTDYTMNFVGDICYEPVRTGVAKQIGVTSMTVKATGLRETNFFLSSDNAKLAMEGSQDDVRLVVPLVEGSGVGLSTDRVRSFDEIKKEILSMRDIEIKSYQGFGDLGGAIKEAAQSGVMWNFVYTPAELGPIAPVSRGWDFTKDAVSSDFTYVLFDWDNIFASYLLSLDSKELAYTNLVAVIKSKTGRGFVPNFSAGGAKSMDRTEPPIGAKVLLEIYKKWGDAWIVELLLDDLVDWSDWFIRDRILDDGSGLIALGSDPTSYDDTCPGAMQGARYESGLDNSPMYDGEFFDSETHLMQLADVGMNGMAIQECDSLVELAKIVNREADVGDRMLERANDLREKMKVLWDDEEGIFVNRFANGTFYRRMSPTSFYAMMGKVATDEQAERMVSEWLMNSTRFCISETYETTNSDECYWGLPSISADDEAFPPLGYWRGFVWGPMAQLTYWSLKQYDHLEIVNTARKALCSQMSAMFLNMWERHGHVCENFSPHKQEEDCTGDKFYHWGALAGFIQLIEDDYY